jgi:hypothetical protein
MRSRHLIYLLIPVAGFTFGGKAGADVLAQYSFTDAIAGTLNRDATTVAPNVTAGSITDAPIVFTHPMVALTRLVGVGYATEPGLAASRQPFNESNIADNVYFTATVSANAGNVLDLSSLTFNLAAGGGSPGDRTYDIRTSLDNFATSLTGLAPINTIRPAFAPISVDLTAAQFQNLASPITFQFRWFTPTFNQNTDWDDITVNGTVVAGPQPVAGDYNGNGIVDAADYVVWRNTLGSTSDLRANGDNTGASANVVDQADYTFWRAHFGNSGSGSGLVLSGQVPEPGSIALGVLGVAGIAFFGIRR